MEDNEENQYRNCPFCGERISAKAKKCRFCKNWVEEDEINCPFCQEKIKATAKKCKFCGEWLPQKKKTFKFTKPLKILSILLLLLIIILITCFSVAVLYVPPCGDNSVKNLLSEHLLSKYAFLKNIQIDKVSIVRQNSNSFVCHAEVTGAANDTETFPFVIEYSYQKSGLKIINITSKPVLSDCYSQMVQDLVVSLIRKSAPYDFIKNVDTIKLENASQDKFDKESNQYECSAQTNFSAKAGQAISIYPFDTENAQDKITCNVEYRSLFCQNGLIQCAAYNNISNCHYSNDNSEEDGEE